MSITRIDQLTAHLGLTSPPPRAQATLNIAEALVASYLSIEFNQRGDALAEHTVSQRITPVRDRQTLEVSGGPVTGIESITYDRTGFLHTGDEVADKDDQFSSVFNPDFSGWIVSGRNLDGSAFTFKAGTQYHITYRTGWSAGRSAYNWQFFRNSSGSFSSADRLGWTFETGDITANNSGGDPVFGVSGTDPDTLVYEMGVQTGDDLVSPALSFEGFAYPFIVIRSSLERASTTGRARTLISWKDGDGRTYWSEKKNSSRGRNYLPDRSRAHAMGSDHRGYTTQVIDMGFLAAGHMDEQLETINRSWLDADVTSLKLGLWEGGASTPNGAKFQIDYIKICDGTARMPEPVLTAVLETARTVSSGGGSGIQAESIGDYSRTFAPGEASQAIPSTARMLLEPYRRPSW